MVNRSYKRSSRVGPVLREVICEVLLKRVQDPRIKGLVVTEVDVSPDLRNCAVYYYCTGKNPDIEAVQAGLESATGLIRKEMSSASTMRYTPKLTFKFDAQIDAARRIEDLLSKLEPGEES